MHRRDVLKGAALGGGAAATACALGATPGARPPAPAAPPATDDALDAALRLLHETDAEYAGGLSNHGPMAAEALESLGHAERIAPFLAGYLPRLSPAPRAEPLPAGRWRDALGRPDAHAALVATFAERLRREAPGEVLADVVVALAPGVVAAAFHGVLRAGHAARAWGRRPSDARRDELARGLAYWAAQYQTLPGLPGRRARRGFGPAEALAGVTFVPAPERRDGLISDRFDVLRGRGDFLELVESFDPDALAPDEALDAMAAAAARLYLGASSPRDRFVYLHGVTSCAALRALLPALAPGAQRQLVAHQFAAIAAVHATHGEASDALSRPWAPPDLGPAALAARAAASPDDHTIKLVEACLREHRRGGPPELLAAAAHRVGAAGG